MNSALVATLKNTQRALIASLYRIIRLASIPPPPFVTATPKHGIATIPTPIVAITRAWLAHDTYNYRHTRERMHGMSAP